MRDWSSGVVIGLYHTAAICIALFFVIETMAAVVPIIPSHIVEEKTVIALCLVASLVGFGWKGFLGHVPLLMQVSRAVGQFGGLEDWIYKYIRTNYPGSHILVLSRKVIHGEDAVMSSVRFIPLLAGNVVCSILAATTVHRLGFRFYLASGLALFTISISLSSTLDATSGIGQEVAFFLEFGAGTGFFLPTLVIAAQAFAREAGRCLLVLSLLSLYSVLLYSVFIHFASELPPTHLSHFVLCLDMAVVTNLIIFLINLSSTIGDVVWDGPASDKQHVLNSIIKFSTEAERAAVVAAFVESAQFFLHAAIPLAAVAFVAAFWVEGYRFSRRS
ncbi:hypothetical protein BC938DRAFT_476020 [Jimgerdemannia flammicorona]|uniref:Major facilitator superfamily domain-containing protein n=1 Tax=Jimgerdemannia flammicorona TaxID=994334 RepID=A0A433QR10_9FUNG|nr:hypothetical protein BC938DRAFT_476020 [Jimgerdemannia flammicorona]